MPIYEFHCQKCDQESEILVRSKDWKGTKCPHCGSTRLAKKFSVFASGGAAAGSGGKKRAEAPNCTGRPSSCGLCGTGRPHSH